MECRDVRARLSYYLEGLLSTKEGGDVADHLLSCTGCNKVADELRRTGEILKDLQRVEPPPWLTAKIMAGIDEKPRIPWGNISWLFRPLAVKVPLQALAVALVVGLSVLLYRANMAEFETAEPTIHSHAGPAEKNATSSLPAARNSTHKDANRPLSTFRAASKPLPTTERSSGDLKQDEEKPSKGQEVNPQLPKEQAAPEAVSAAPTQERHSEDKREGTFDRARPLDTTRELRGAGGSPMAPRKVQASPAPLAGTGRTTTSLADSVEEMLKSLDARDVTKEVGAGGTLITAVLPRHSVSGLSEKLSHFPGVRLTPAPEAPAADSDYRTVRIEITTP